MRDDVTMYRRLSLTEPIHRSLAYHWWDIPPLNALSCYFGLINFFDGEDNFHGVGKQTFVLAFKFLTCSLDILLMLIVCFCCCLLHMKQYIWVKYLSLDGNNPPCHGSLVLNITLRPRQNGRLFADDTFKCIFLNENIRILIKISLRFVPKGLINNIPALVLIIAWRRPGAKPLSELMIVTSLTHICVTRPQWDI